MAHQPKLITVVAVRQGCEANPSEWDALTDDRRRVYVRYRWGKGSVYMGPPGDMAEVAGVSGVLIVEWKGDSEWDGRVPYALMCACTAHVIVWPPVCPTPDLPPELAELS